MVGDSLQPGGGVNRVRIRLDDNIAESGIGTHLAGVGDALTVISGDDPGAELAGDSGGAVRAAVINDDNLEIAPVALSL